MRTTQLSRNIAHTLRPTSSTHFANNNSIGRSRSFAVHPPAYPAHHTNCLWCMCAGIHHNLRARWQSTHNGGMFECSAGRMTRGDRSDADFMTAIRRPDRRSEIQSADPVLSQSTRPHTPHTTPTVSAACAQAFITTCVLGGKPHTMAGCMNGVQGV